MKKEIIILQFAKKFDICGFIKAAMVKVHPELLEQTQFFTNLKDAKEQIITPRKNLLSAREGKPMLVVTGAVLMDENGDKIIKKISKWNPKAEFIVFSSNTDGISDKKSIKKVVVEKIETHNTPDCYESLITKIYKIVNKGLPR